MADNSTIVGVALGQVIGAQGIHEAEAGGNPAPHRGHLHAYEAQEIPVHRHLPLSRTQVPLQDNLLAGRIHPYVVVAAILEEDSSHRRPGRNVAAGGCTQRYDLGPPGHGEAREAGVRWAR